MNLKLRFKLLKVYFISDKKGGVEKKCEICGHMVGFQKSRKTKPRPGLLRMQIQRCMDDSSSGLPILWHWLRGMFWTGRGLRLLLPRLDLSKS